MIDLKTMKERAERGVEIIKDGGQYVICCPPDDMLALLHRIERYEAAMKQAEYDLCHFYDVPATHDKSLQQIRREMYDVFKESI